MTVSDSNYPKFAQTPRNASAVLTSASSTVSNTPPNTVQVGTVGINGALLTRGSALPLISATACSLYLFYSIDGGATKQFFASVVIPAYTQAAATPPTETLFAYSEDAPKRLAGGAQLWAGLSSAQAGGIIINLDWTDF